MMIKYVVYEDGDDELHPNVFNLSGHSSPSLGMIKKVFPLPGEYHFRFLTTISGAKVWVDVSDNAVSVPFYDGGIFMKVVRLEKLDRNITSNNISSDNARYMTSAISEINSSGNISKSDKLLSFESEDDSDLPQPFSQSKSVNDTGDLLGIDSPGPDFSSTKQQQAPMDLFGLNALQQAGNILNKPIQSGNFSSMPPRGMPGNNTNSFDAFSNLQQFTPRGPPYHQRK